MSLLPKAIYRFHAIPIKISMTVLKEIERKNNQICVEPQNTPNSNPEKKECTISITLPDLKLYYRATIIKTASY